MKITVTIFLVSLLFNCKTTQTIDSKWTPSQTEGCISQQTTNDRLKCISNWIRTQEQRQNAVIESKEIEGERLNQRHIKVTYFHCIKNKQTGQVFECINHETIKYKPTLLVEIYDTLEPFILLGIGIAIGGFVL